MANMQHPIIRPLVFREHGHHPIIQLTTGWLLSDIQWWDNREHTPLSGYGHYPSTFEVISLFVPIWKNAERDCLFRSPKTPSMGSRRREKTRLLLITGGDKTHILTSSLMINSGPIWSEGLNGSNRWIVPRSTIQSFYLFCGADRGPWLESSQWSSSPGYPSHSTLNHHAPSYITPDYEIGVQGKKRM